MKNLLFFVLLLFPMVMHAQQVKEMTTASGHMWMNVGNAGFTPGNIEFPSLAISPTGVPYLAYVDVSDIFYMTISVRKFDGAGWTSVGAEGFDTVVLTPVNLTFSPSGVLYVAYADYHFSGREAVRKFDGTNWVPLGIPGFSGGSAAWSSMAVSQQEEPYVAYCDYNHSRKVTVMKFDGANWVTIGSPGFSAADVEYVSLAISPAGEPYVAYQDLANSRKISVMRFDGTYWLPVGIPGISVGEAYWTSFAFSPSGVPYVAFMDGGNGYKVIVMKFDGSNWVSLGDAGASTGAGQCVSLAFGSDGPYVSYNDGDEGFKTTLRKFDGTSWVNVGNDGFSEGETSYTSLAFGLSGQPFVAFEDRANFGRATVMKYDSVMVGTRELIPAGLSVYPNPAGDRITVETAVLQDKSLLTFTNMFGQEILARQVTNCKTIIDIGNLPAGVYFIRIANDDALQPVRFVKMQY